MSIGRIMAIFGRVVNQFRRDHRTLGLIFIVPVFVMAILGFVFRAQEGETIKLAVVNQDVPPAGQTSLAATVIEGLVADSKSDDSRLEVITMESYEAARSAVERGEQGAAVVFGPDFTAAASKVVTVTVEGSNPGKTGGTMGAVGQALLKGAPTLIMARLRSLLPVAPPQLGGAPLEVRTERLYGKEDLEMLDFFAPMFIAYFAFFLVFLLTSVSFLRERTQGTMERLSASPVTRMELVLGYMLGFGLFAMVQATVLVLFTLYALDLKSSGNVLSIFVVTLGLVLGAVNLGIFLSAYARNELQAIQFIPIVIIPQVLLSGLLWPVADMPGWLQPFARIMPLTYAIDALTDIMIRDKGLLATWAPIAVLFAFAAAAAALAAWSVRREIA